MKTKLKKLKTINVIYFIISIILMSVIIYMLIDFSNTKPKQNSISLGDSVIFKLNENQSSSTALALSGACLPNDVILQSTKVIAPTNKNIYVRACAYIVSPLGNKTYVEISTMPNWTNGNDNFYYYNTALTANTYTWFSEKITLPSNENMPLDSKVNYNLIICVENLENASLVEQIWTTAPQFWIDSL